MDMYIFASKVDVNPKEDIRFETIFASIDTQGSSGIFDSHYII
jgi:hypothetical protein